MLRVLLPGLLLVAASLPARADGDDRSPRVGERVTLARLRQPDEKEAAWAAHFAGEQGFTSAIPLIERRLAMLGRAKPETSTFPAAEVYLDALLRLDATPAEEVLLPHLGSGDAAVVILARHPECYAAALMHVFREEQARYGCDLRWLASGNALANIRAPGFAAAVLPQVTLEVRIRVRDQEEPLPPWGDPSDSVPGSGLGRVEEGWPPVAVWNLEQAGHADADALPVARGPVDCFAERSVFRHRLVWSHHNISDHVERPPVRRGWLDRLVPRPSDLPPLAHFLEVQIRYTGEQPWAREIRQIHDARAEEMWSWARGLIDAGSMTTEEARAIAPRLQFEIRDERRDKRRALPPVPACETQNPFTPRVLSRRIEGV